MTREEAMDLLDNLIGMVEDNQDNDYDEALKMGIKVLQRTSNAHPTHSCVGMQVTGKLMSVEIPTKRESEEEEKQVKGDSISREDAMMEARPEYLNPIQKGHEEYNKGWNDGVEAYWNGLKELPSAEPEKEIPRRVLWSGWKGRRDTRYKCPNCNKPVKKDDVYCHRCGQKLMFPHISHTPYIEGQKQELIVRWDDEE